MTLRIAQKLNITTKKLVMETTKPLKYGLKVFTLSLGVFYLDVTTSNNIAKMSFSD